MKSTALLKRLRNGLSYRWNHRDWYLMRLLGRSRLVRGVMPILRSWRREVPVSAESSVFPDLDIQATAERLKRDGFAPGIILPTDLRETLLGYVGRTPCYANKGTDFAFLHHEHDSARATFGEPIHLGAYYNMDTELPELSRLARDPALLDIAHRYLNAPPEHMGTHLWWSFVDEHTDSQLDRYAQLFHYDLDDYAFLKFFFYLTDVDEDAGPHVFVLGSQVGRPLGHRLWLRRFTDEEIEETYGRERVHVICAHAGHGFAEDTYGLHKGVRPRTRPRLLLQLQYGLRDYGLQHGRKTPEQLGQGSNC